MTDIAFKKARDVVKMMMGARDGINVTLEARDVVSMALEDSSRSSHICGGIGMDIIDSKSRVKTLTHVYMTVKLAVDKLVATFDNETISDLTQSVIVDSLGGAVTAAADAARTARAAVKLTNFTTYIRVISRSDNDYANKIVAIAARSAYIALNSALSAFDAVIFINDEIPADFVSAVTAFATAANAAVTAHIDITNAAANAIDAIIGVYEIADDAGVVVPENIMTDVTLSFSVTNRRATVVPDNIITGTAQSSSVASCRAAVTAADDIIQITHNAVGIYLAVAKNADEYLIDANAAIKDVFPIKDV
jgi:hypothetical protein